MPVVNRVPGLVATGAQYLPLSGPGVQAAGRTVISAGSAMVIVSNTLVKSNAIVQILSTQSNSVSATSAGYLVVASLVQGVSFAFVRSNTIVAPYDETINWRIFYPAS